MKSWEALQVNEVKGGKEARKLLEKAEQFLKKESNQNKQQYDGARSMFLYAQAKAYYKSSESEKEKKKNFSTAKRPLIACKNH